MSVSASRCVRLKEPLRCSPLGLPDIISHYPRHSSNTAGARKHGSLVGARLPHVYVLFFCCSVTRLAPWGLSKRNSWEAGGDANLYILEEHADVVSREEKGKGIHMNRR